MDFIPKDVSNFAVVITTLFVVVMATALVLSIKLALRNAKIRHLEDERYGFMTIAKKALLDFYKEKAEYIIQDFSKQVHEPAVISGINGIVKVLRAGDFGLFSTATSMSHFFCEVREVQSLAGLGRAYSIWADMDSTEQKWQNFQDRIARGIKHESALAETYFNREKIFAEQFPGI